MKSNNNGSRKTSHEYSFVIIAIKSGILKNLIPSFALVETELAKDQNGNTLLKKLKGAMLRMNTTNMLFEVFISLVKCAYQFCFCLGIPAIWFLLSATGLQQILPFFRSC